MRGGRVPVTSKGASMLKARFALPAVLVAGSLPTAAMANYSDLTAAVDWTQVSAALFAVAALIAGILVVRKGIRFVLGMIR